ncbi:HlyD family efflux transporter periplasmic adaptor subunit [Cellvibrio mixtus]|uniref:HlyD family efflux transporter periplasmic adaptor subunit n=1 Tax=Cellvibrio mixtus TaxID=39650 RepID=UPI000587372D|nr:HlyD family efflux transporter periplasmic adaptor subunit [Cellvibrio mixtus]
MQSLKAFKIWLSMQCQILGNVSAAILVKSAADNPLILAKWPNTDVDTVLLFDAINPVMEKKRLHLQVLGTNDYLLGQPLIIDEQFWGVLVLRVSLLDKKALPGLLHLLKPGQFWLQFMVQSLGSELAAGREPAVSATDVVSTVQPVRAATPDLPLVSLKESINGSLLQLTASLLKENSLQETTITLVNLLAGLLQATRVSIGLLDSSGKRLQLDAVSFSANFDKRTQAMQLITEAMAEAVEQGVRIDCVVPNPDQVESTDASALLIKQAHQQLLHTQQLHAVNSFLLRKGEKIIGVLTIELDRRTTLDSDQEWLVQQATHYAAAIIQLRQQAVAGLWQGLRQRIATRLQHWLGEESWRGKLIAIGAMVLLVALFVPVNYQLSADASLQTTEKYLLVSPQDAYLGTISARPGDQVKKGTVLAQLNDEDLRLERRKVASQAQQYRQAYDSALANSNRVEAAIANAQLDQASIQLQLLDQQLTRTQLLAPSDGIVVSDDISQTRGAPVKQGDVLFEIAASRNYLVQLFVDERDIALVKPGLEGELKLNSLPTETFNTRVKLITPISEVREGRNYFRVELELVENLQRAELLRPGMTGTGKVNVGSRALGWIWFHDLWHWLRLSIW